MWFRAISLLLFLETAVLSSGLSYERSVPARLTTNDHTEQGGPLHLRCDAATIGLDQHQTRVLSVAIMKVVPGQKSPKIYGKFNPFSAFAKKYMNVPLGWSLKFSEVPTWGCSWTMYVEALTYDAKPGDSGTYQCSVSYQTDSTMEKFWLGQQDINVIRTAEYRDGSTAGVRSSAGCGDYAGRLTKVAAAVVAAVVLVV